MVWSIRGVNFIPVSSWFISETEETYNLFELGIEELRQVISETNHFDEAKEIYLEAINSKDQPAEEKQKILAVFQEEYIHHESIMETLMLENCDAFATYVTIATPENLKKLFRALEKKSRLTFSDSIFRFLVTCIVSRISHVNPREVCLKVITNVSYQVLAQFSQSIDKSISTYPLGFLISAGENEFFKESLMKKIVPSISPSDSVQFIDGLCKGCVNFPATLPPCLSYLFFSYPVWTINVFHTVFHSVSSDIKALALIMTPEAKREKLIIKALEKGREFSALMKSIYSFQLDFEDKVALCKQILTHLNERILKKFITETSDSEILFFILIYADIKVTEENPELLVKISTDKIPLYNRKKLTAELLKNAECMECISETSVLIEYYDGDYPIEDNLTFEEVGEKLKEYDLQNLNDAQRTALLEFLKGIPSIFFILAGNAEEPTQARYMKFFPYFTISQLSDFASSLRVDEENDEVMEKLEEHCRTLTIEQNTAIFASLPPDRLNYLLNKHYPLLKKEYEFVQNDCPLLDKAIAELKSANMDRASSIYKTSYEKIQSLHITLTSRLRFFNSSIYQAFPFVKSSFGNSSEYHSFHLFAICLYVQNANALQKSLILPSNEVLTFLQTARPTQKRKSEEPTEDKLDFKAGVLQGISRAVARSLKITIESLKTVGIHSQKDLYVLGMTNLNPQKHKAILEKYLNQEDLSESWEVLTKKNIWSLFAVKELGVKDEELFILSGIVKKIREGSNG